MRALLILTSLLLVGCSELESELENAVSEIENLGTNYKNEPKFTKEPTYLKCLPNNIFTPEGDLWVVIDHENELFITVRSDEKPDNKETIESFVHALPLTTTERFYGRLLDDYSQSKWKLNRTDLTFSNGDLEEYQCEIVDDLSELRAVGVEKARPKI